MVIFESMRRALKCWGWNGPTKSDMFRALSDDVIVKIIGQLPIDQILRCRAVCKKWRHLIDEPNFAEAHLLEEQPSVTVFQDLSPYVSGAKAEDGLGLYLIHPKRNKTSRRGDIKRMLITRAPVPSWFVTFENPPFIRGSCNGWILFQGFWHPPLIYFICNPVTQEFKMLSKTVETVCGFYFHPSRKEYRLLCAGERTVGNFSYYVCDLDRRQDSVKLLGVHPHKPRAEVAPAPVIVDGFLYNMTDHQTVRGIYSIMMLDLDNEVLQFGPHPGRSAGLESVPRERTYLFEAEGRVCFCCAKQCIFQIWSLEDRASWSWVKRFSLPLEYVAGTLPQIQPMFMEDGVLVLNLEGWGLLWFDTKTGKVKNIDIKTRNPDGSADFSDIPAATCKMSMISLSKLNL